MDTLYAEIVLPLPVSGSYTYSIPSHLAGRIVSGSRVVVSFGARKVFTGVVFEVHSRKPTGFKVKPVTDLLAGYQINNALIDLIRWISSYYMAATGEVLRAAIPSSLLPSGRTIITLASDNYDSLDVEEQWLMDIVAKRNSIYIDRLPGQKDRRSILSIVNSLLDKGLISVGEEVHEELFSREEMDVVLSSTDLSLDSLDRAPRQRELVELFLSLAGKAGRVKRSLLIREYGKGASVMNTLINKGVLKLEPAVASGIISSEDVMPPSPLSESQADAYSQILSQLRDHEVVLLRGVTSSGKTEIYIHLIEEILGIGGQVLYMLPEIAITTQIIERLQKYFGERIGIYHSRMTPRARLNVWKRVASDKPGERLNLVLGVRSSVFLPFGDLKMVIVDEEHDPSYKQYDPAPRYHARDTAMMLSRLHGGRTLLGSATPSVESYYNALAGRYGLVTLLNRYGDVMMPEILLSDMRYLHRDKRNRHNYSKPLLDTVTMALSKKEQTILFQNRRGFSPFITCRDCGWVHGCPDCSVSFTYHKGINKMVCHYCGHSQSPVSLCPQCGSTELSTMGLGTEKIEEEVKTMFPYATVSRMDQDTTRTRGAHSLLLSDFAGGATDILIGTQMISKGLDFENLTVVGILDADSMLNYPDFRAHERSFQMMEQVSGRAGRRQKRGKVIIQTSNPAHYVLRHVLKHDYKAMYESQIAERQEFGYPPFTRLVRISIKHRDNTSLDRIASSLALEMRRHMGKMVLGPEYPPVMQVQKWYIKNILVKMPREASVVRIKELIKGIIDAAIKEGGSSLRISIDVDPQ